MVILRNFRPRLIIQVALSAGRGGNLFRELGVAVHIRSDNLHRQTRQNLAGQVVGQAALHQARQPLGEWLYRIFQWKNAR